MSILINTLWRRCNQAFTAIFLAGCVFSVFAVASTAPAQTDNQPNSQPYGYNLIPERDAYTAPSQKSDQAPPLVNFELHTHKIRLLPSTQSSGRGASFGDDPVDGGAPGSAAGRLAH